MDPSFRGREHKIDKLCISAVIMNILWKKKKQVCKEYVKRHTLYIHLYRKIFRTVDEFWWLFKKIICLFTSLPTIYSLPVEETMVQDVTMSWISLEYAFVTANAFLNIIFNGYFHAIWYNFLLTIFQFFSRWLYLQTTIWLWFMLLLTGKNNSENSN